MTDPRAPRRTPEHPPMGAEGGGDRDKFNDLLSGVNDLASVTRTSAVDFVFLAFDEMAKVGMEPDDYKVGMIMKYGFGSREDVAERVAGMTEEEFAETYPDQIGDLVRWYLEPSADDEPQP